MAKKLTDKLSSTKKKISKEWAKYRKVKSSLSKRKDLSTSEKKHVLQSEHDLAKQRITKHWDMYDEVKRIVKYKSPYKGFHFHKTMHGSLYKPKGHDKKEYFKFHDSYQKIFKANKNFNPDDLDKIVPGIFDEKNVKGVLLVFQIHNIDEDTDQVVSNFINPELWELLQEREESVYEYVLERFQGYGNYKLRFIYLRIIYAKK